ncbi:MAG: putative sporulation protein YtxC [Clostridia bacterium]|nr:putative sporulation protein YtxC [Clostridia bacterium]
MQFLCIGVNDCADDVMQHLTCELQQIKNKKLKYSIDEVNSGNSTSIICSLDDDRLLSRSTGQLYDTLRVHVSNALADFIIRQYEERLITRIINSNYCYFNSKEKKEILNIAVEFLKNEDKDFFNTLFRIRRRNVIVRKLFEYFERSNSLILDGFVNFRLKEYMKDLEEIVEKAVDDFLMEREYKEFIRLLRYFVDIQESKFDIIHVMVGNDNKYVILNETLREITNECIQEFANEISEGEVNYDDLLVSSLITMAPRKLILHGTGRFKNKELLETIKNVFSEKVVICNGCDVCLVNNMANK